MNTQTCHWDFAGVLCRTCPPTEGVPISDSQLMTFELILSI